MSNPLYPIFLKLHQLQVLIVGGGAVAEEKLHFMLKSSPEANILLVAPEISEQILGLASTYNIVFRHEPFKSDHLEKQDLVIVATNDQMVNKEVAELCRQENILVNVADTPELCDFYLGGVVTKGDVKIAISTHGKSPTLAKRLREMLEDILPNDIHELANNLNAYRKTLKGNFEYKVKALNDLTLEVFGKRYD